MTLSFKDPLRRPPGPFCEGDRVGLLWGVTPVEGVIIEDRGNVGVGGRRFYRVRCQLDDNISPPMDISAPAADLTLVAKAPRPPSRRRKKKQR